MDLRKDSASKLGTHQFGADSLIFFTARLPVLRTKQLLWILCGEQYYTYAANIELQWRARNHPESVPIGSIEQVALSHTELRQQQRLSCPFLVMGSEAISHTSGLKRHENSL